MWKFTNSKEKMWIIKIQSRVYAEKEQNKIKCLIFVTNCDKYSEHSFKILLILLKYRINSLGKEIRDIFFQFKQYCCYILHIIFFMPS